MKKTKILSTIGPSSFQKEKIEKMVEAGMNGIRINTAYGGISQYDSVINEVRKITDIPIVVDIKGPEIRLKVAKKKDVEINDYVEVGFNDEEISFNHDFYDEISVGDIVYIDNGKIKTRVSEKGNRSVNLLLMAKGVLDNGKGVNIPNKRLSVPTFGREDLEIIKFAAERNVEYVALSFVRNIQDLENLKSQGSSFEGGIIAKIENFEGVENFDEILSVADGIMVARGDLGIEIEPEKVPLVQKSIIRKCNQNGKPVITATEMLESMIHQPTPTRAEVSDVANAIIDGTDAVMLSGETAVGKFPVEAVKMMARIAKEIENKGRGHVEDDSFVNISDTVSKAIQRICQNMHIDKVITLTRSGYTARMIARLKIKQPIIAVTPAEKTKKQLELVFGVFPVQFDYQNEKDRIYSVTNKLLSMELISETEIAVFTSAVRTALKHASNSIEIHRISELEVAPK